MTAAPPPVLIPFVCPVCAGANAAHLVSLSRAGGMPCVCCKAWLRSADIMRAMHSPRAARAAESPATPPPAPRAAHDVRRDRDGRRAIEWPPTPKTRASAVRLINRDRETPAPATRK